VKKFLTAAVALSVLASAGAASAQPGPRNDSRYEQNRDRQDRRAERRDDRRDDRADRRDERRDDRYERRAARRYSAGRYQAPRGYQARQWHRGQTLPRSYRDRRYVVDYRRYGLGAPPRGYQYVRVGDDVVLTAVATGLITSVILQLFQ
jgi:Ni/Co efflux regulator RcnB